MRNTGTMISVTTMKKMMIKWIKAYQLRTQGRMSTCKYRPTCSNYAISAYENYHFIIATFLTLWRILRCNPFSRGGYDPIPKFKKELKNQLEQEERTLKG
jgi:putative membrane protein insertion efficiency factor